MKKMKTILIMLSFSTMIFAQVPKNVLLEYATNASCPPCASSNPGNYEFLKKNYKNTVSVWYHAWWPGSNDPMYVANMDENAARINYYNINGVPAYVINGVRNGYGDEGTKMQADHALEAGLMSPLDMSVVAKMDGDSVRISVSIKVLGEVSQSGLVLHTAITEQMVVYPNPPGSNGEVDFPHVFRKFCAGAGGEAIADMNIGDSLVYNYAEELDESWNPDVLTMVAWVQSPSTKEVLQSASNLFFYEVVTETPKIDFLSKDENAERIYSLENIMQEPLNVRIKHTLLQNNENWEYSLSYNGNPFDSVDITIDPEETAEFSLKILTNQQTGSFEIEIAAVNLDPNSNFRSVINYFSAVISGDILIVDDDGGMNYENNYTTYLDGSAQDYTKLDVNTVHRIKEEVSLNDYTYVFWNLGIESPSLDAADATIITEYLQNGGYLFIAGQDLGYDIHEVTKLSNPRFLYSVFFDALYVANTDSSSTIIPVPGNPYFEDITIEFNDVYPLSPDAIQSKRGSSIPVLKYSDSENAALLFNIKENAKIAYLAVGLEQISNEEHRDLILSEVMDWFNTPVNVESEADVMPERHFLGQNYPNPFNPVTKIKYSIPVFSSDMAEGQLVSLKVYDILGRIVKTLVDQKQNPGNYEVEFSGNDFNSGVYFYELKSGSYRAVKKMMLLK